MASDTSDYPGAVDSFTDLGANFAGPPLMSDVIKKLHDAVEKLQTEVAANASWWMGKSYANATARDAEITSPTAGMSAFLADNDIVTVHDGSAWWQWPRQQVRQTTGSTDGSGTLSITFPVAFSRTPRVVANIRKAGGDYSTVVHNESTTGFDVWVYLAGSAHTSSSVVINWIAVEPTV